jgi:hypothetical protein
MEEKEEAKPEKIRVVEKLPNEDAKITEIANDYKSISKFCGGLIDITTLATDSSVDIICNDEFLYNGMEPNIVTPETEGVLCGPIILCGYDPDNGNSISLTDKQADEALKYCARNNLHHMSLEGAYRYSKVIGPLQQSEDELNKQAREMEAQ